MDTQNFAFGISHKHRSVVIEQDRRAAQILPHTVFKDNWLVIPHRLDTTKVLRNLGYRVPAPILTDYDWAGQTPFDSQKATAALLSTHYRDFVLNEMGTGKTLAALFAFDYLRSVGEAHKMLVVAPLSTLNTVWAYEIFMRMPHLETAILHGTKAQRLKALAGDADIYIINHDGLKTFCDTKRSGRSTKFILGEEMSQRNDIDVILLDELAVYRNRQTDRWKTASVFAEGRTWVWGLTGGPVPKAPTDAFAQVKLINPTNVGWSFKAFREEVMYQVNQFKWLPRPNALETVYEAMQPAVRFTRAECMDLPPTTYSVRYAALSKEQQGAYQQMQDDFVVKHPKGTVTALNSGVQVSKLLQCACIAEGTEILSEVGWVPIEQMSSEHRVWDGAEWVTHEGPIFKGHKEVIECGGVRMTPDHLCWTTEGWQRADGESSERFNWATVRLPDSCATSRNNHGEKQKSDLVVPVRLWQRSGTREPVSTRQKPLGPAALRVPERQQDAWNDRLYPVSSMGRHQTTVLQQAIEGLQELGRTWHNRMRPLARLIRRILCRHGLHLQGRSLVGASGQQWPVFPGELPLGDLDRAAQQQKRQPGITHPQGKTYSVSSSPRVRGEGGNPIRKTDPLRVGPRTGTYDLINCGPRNRFVVRGRDGTARIVHNCGFMYNGDVAIDLDHKARGEVVREVVEEADSKVIIFVPFKRAIRLVEAAVNKMLTPKELLAGHKKHAVVTGDTPKKERDRIFTAFQHSPSPQVLIAHPKVVAHGLTLTRANTILWYAVWPDLEIYEQACARVARPGQNLHTHIIHIAGTAIEKKIARTLEKRGNVQKCLLELFTEDNR